MKQAAKVTFAKSIPWAIHLQASHQQGAQEQGRFSLILEANSDTLLALFAVDKMGFPFSFGDAERERAAELVEVLEEAGLIEENPVNEGKKYLEGPMFQLVDFSFYDRLLITSLCYHAGTAASLGYIGDMRPNFAFGQQGLFCPWEHCIELSPLPMRSRAEWAADLEEDKRRLADPQKYHLTEQNIEVLTARTAEGIPDWVPEVADAELAARSCFFFGHACPGGRVQANSCREQGHFEWPTKDRSGVGTTRRSSTRSAAGASYSMRR